MSGRKILCGIHMVALPQPIFQTVRCDFDTSTLTLQLKFVILILQAMQNFVWNFAVFLVAFASFTTYSLSVSDTLSVGTAFVSLGKL